MKNSKKSLGLSVLTIAFSLYLFGTPVAMAEESKATINQDTTQDVKSSVSRNTIEDAKADDSQNTVQKSETDDGGNAVQKSETDDSGNAVQKSETDDSGNTVQKSETDDGGNAVQKSETDDSGNAVQKSETDDGGNAVQKSEVNDIRKSVQNTKPDVSGNSVHNTEPDTVSTADEFTAWLESHKNVGGSVKLTDDIILKEFYEFIPDGASQPDVIVDTDTYTITAAGNITFLSDGQLIFRGRAGSRGVFHVLKGGILTLDGVIVEGTTEENSSQYTLWQEEGAGLLLGNTFAPCRVSGEIHYADTPFVLESSSACVIVEKGQSADGLFPAQIECNVNYQGQKQYHEQVPVSWELVGTEEQQEQRQRFQVEGYSSQAAFAVPPICTVVYHDYPLTFTYVKATIKGSAYYFQGGYIKPQKELPITVASEYSFDGNHWIVCDEDIVTNVKESFTIYFPCAEWDKEEKPYLYIRLRGQMGNNTFYSNVLRYEAGSMNVAEDLGGSRGGGTSIVNPTDEPKKEDFSGTSSGNQRPSESQKPSKPSKPSQESSRQGTESGNYDDNDNDQGASGDVSDTDASTVDESNSSGTDRAKNRNAAQNITDNNTPLNSNVPEKAESVNQNKGSSSAAVDTEGNDDSGADESSADGVSKETVEFMSEELAASAYEGEEDTRKQHVTVSQRLNNTRNIVLVSGFVTLSAGAGVAGYFVHTRNLRRHRQRGRAANKGSRKK